MTDELMLPRSVVDGGGADRKAKDVAQELLAVPPSELVVVSAKAPVEEAAEAGVRLAGLRGLLIRPPSTFRNL